MKKSLFILLIVFAFFKSNSQTVLVYSEDFNSLTPPSVPAGWSAGIGYFLGEDGTNNPCGGTCTVAASSGGNMLSCYDGGVPDEATSPVFSTLGKSTMTMSLNQLRDNTSTATFTILFSTDGGSTFPISVPFTNSAANCSWTAVPAITLPASIDNQSTVCFQIALSGGSGNAAFHAFDDIIINGVQSPVFYYKGTGALDVFANWGANPNGTGTAPTSFTTVAQTFYITNASAVNFNNMSGNNVTFSGTGSMLYIGTGTNNINVTIPTTHTLTVNGGCGLVISNQGTLTLQNTLFPTSSVTLSTGSAVNYNQASGTINVIPTTHYDMLISGGADVTSVNTFSVSNNLIITSGNYKMSVIPPNSVSFLGPISVGGSGSIITANSKLIIGGSGAIGTINFTGTQAVSQFTLDRTGQTLTLGSSFTVNSTASIANGNININGKSLRFSGATTFGTGNFVGSTTSSLTVSGALTGTLKMDQTSASTRALSDLTLNNASGLTLSNPLEIWGAITPSVGTITTGGNLTIKQNTTNKGRIGTISTGGFSGNVTAECFAPGPTTGWALLGCHGISGQTMNNWYGQFPMTLEGSATGVTSAGGYFESVQGWNEADAYGYDTTITVSTPLAQGQGFWTYLGTGPSTTSDITITLTGSAITGNVTIPLTNSAQSGTCLVANPYCSPISWTALRNANPAVTNAVYIYNANGTYASFVSGVGTNGGSDNIPSGQGFYVVALSNTSLAAKETNKISNNTNLMKTNSEASTANTGLPIKLTINGFSGEADETAIRFHGAATNAYDIEYDAYKIFQTPGYVGYPGSYSKYTTISTKGGNTDYSINSLPYALTQNAVIPVLVKVMASGQYTISGQDMQLLPPGACVTLKDKLLNITHNIKASPYVCTVNDTTSAARFELTVCADVTTGINDNNTSVANDLSVNVMHDLNGIDVDLNFDKTTKARISVTNILGQKIVENKKVTTQNEKVHFGLEPKNQLLFVTVETENSKITKKIIH